MLKRRARFAALFVAVGGLGIVSPCWSSPPSSSYKMIFGDAFNGTTLDQDKWNYNYTWSQHGLQDNSVEESSAVTVNNGVMDITATATPVTYNGTTYGYTSGAINTSGKFNFTYGYLEARQQMPTQQGTWPAFWSEQPGGWPPEIDVQEVPEFTSNESQYSVTYHYGATASPQSVGNKIQTGQNLSAGFHDYGVDWQANSLTFYFDETAVATVTSSQANIAQLANNYLLLDLGVGGWPGNPPAGTSFPAVMQTQWVHVYQVPSSTATSAWNIAGGGSWGTGSNWTHAIPSYQDVIADFGQVGTATASAVSWGGVITSGGFVFGDPANLVANNTSYTLGSSVGSGSQVEFASSSGNALVHAMSTSNADQTINADIDLYNNTTFQNDMAANSIILSGVISDAGSLTVQGAGTVEFNNNNTYTGPTYIGNVSGTQGPADALVMRSRPFGPGGGAGVVYLGPNGNATTAVIQLSSSPTGSIHPSIPNTIDFDGRNNATPGIENLQGSNSITGTINAVTGGGTYLIQSDSGLLTLSGAADTTTPGVAIESASGVSGTRTFTLGGAGNGIVTGVIQNGGATNLCITKSGGGEWTLAAANSNTGTTSVSGGELLLDQGGSLKNSNITITGGTLAGGTNGAGGTLDFNLTGNTSDLISLSGSGVLDLTNMKLSLVISGTQTQQQYVIANQDVGSSFVLGQKFEAVSGLPNGWAIDYSGTTADAGDIVLATPEPGPAGLLGLALAGFVGRRRRRVKPGA